MTNRSGALPDVQDILNRLPQAKVVVAGDLMLDRFVYGEVGRISPEAPIPVLKINNEINMLGGSGNVVSNLHGLETEAVLIAVTGQDTAAGVIRGLLAERGLSAAGLVDAPGRPTTIKTRFLASHQQLLRTDEERTDAVETATEEALIAAAKAHVQGAGALILSDYGKGTLTPRVTRALIDMAKEAHVPVLVDPKGSDYSIYRGADIVTPNRKELAEATGGMATRTDTEVVAAAQTLMARAGIGAVIATRSQDGMSIIEGPNANPVHLRTEALEVFDVSGAGDTVIATIAAALAAKASLLQAAALANSAGGIVVAKVGTAAIRRAELQDALLKRELDIRPGHDSGKTRVVDRVREAPVLERPDAIEQVRRWQARGLKVGFTNGCFDILHPGHVRYLNRARDKCDRLVVGVNADESVRRLKGPERPVNNEAARADVLAALGAVDLVAVFGRDIAEEDKASKLVEALRPDIYFKGGDYTEAQIPEAKIVRAYGGEVELTALYEGHSTTATIKRMKA